MSRYNRLLVTSLALSFQRKQATKCEVHAQADGQASHSGGAHAENVAKQADQSSDALRDAGGPGRR